MRSITVLIHLSLDGVMQAPGRPDEDTRDGFTYGGWARPRTEAMGVVDIGGNGEVELLFGRRTYDDFFAFWPQQTDNPFTALLDATNKYVASSTLQEPLPWQNSTLLTGDAAEAVARLKAQPGPDLLIMGSGVLVQSLLRHHLIDRFVLPIHPLVLGSGRRLFEPGGSSVEFQLVNHSTTPSGVIITTYSPTAP